MIAQREDCRVVAGIDMKDGQMNGIPVYDSLDKLDGKGCLLYTSPSENRQPPHRSCPRSGRKRPESSA